MAIKYDATADAVAEIATEVCRRFAAGFRGSQVFNGVPFEYTDIARCSEFVRECTEAAAGRSYHGNASPVYFGGTARETEAMLRKHGKLVTNCLPGDIVCFNAGNVGKWGHIGIVRDGGTYFENTSSPDRGPGFVVSRFSEIGWGRVSGFYRILLPRAAATTPAAKSTPLMIVKHATGAVLARYQVVPNGAHLEQGKVYVE